MKKICALLISCLMVVALFAGCSSDNQQATNTDNAAPLRVAMDLKFPPFASIDANGNPTGIEVDIAYALGEYLGRPVEIVNTDFAMLIPSLETGETDIVICDMTVKEERKEKVDFSSPYLYNRTLGLVNKNFATLNNITDDMSEQEFFALPARYVGLAGTIAVSIPESYGHQVQSFTEIGSALMEVNNGTADVLIGANTIIRDQASFPDTTIIYGGIKEYSESAMAVKKGNTELLTQVNAFIQTMYEPGGFYANATAEGTYDQAIHEYLKDDTKGLAYIIYPPENGKLDE